MNIEFTKNKNAKKTEERLITYYREICKSMEKQQSTGSDGKGEKRL